MIRTTSCISVIVVTGGRDDKFTVNFVRVLGSLIHFLYFCLKGFLLYCF